MLITSRRLAGGRLITLAMTLACAASLTAQQPARDNSKVNARDAKAISPSADAVDLAVSALKDAGFRATGAEDIASAGEAKGDLQNTDKPMLRGSAV